MVRTFLKKYFITARILESLGEFSKILNHRHSLTEAAKLNKSNPLRDITNGCKNSKK